MATRPHLGYLDIGTKGYHLLEQPCGFPLQPQHLRRTDRCDCGGMLEYIRDISILGRLGLYPYPTRSVGEASCPPSHVPLYIQPKAQANTIHQLRISILSYT